MLQLFPFGWMKADGTPHREEIYLNMVTAANCSYSNWINKRADHAFLRRCGRAWRLDRPHLVTQPMSTGGAVSHTAVAFQSWPPRLHELR